MDRKGVLALFIRIYLYRIDDGFVMPEYKLPPEQVLQVARADYPEYHCLGWEELESGLYHAVIE